MLQLYTEAHCLTEQPLAIASNRLHNLDSLPEDMLIGDGEFVHYPSLHALTVEQEAMPPEPHRYERATS